MERYRTSDNGNPIKVSSFPLNWMSTNYLIVICFVWIRIQESSADRAASGCLSCRSYSKVVAVKYVRICFVSFCWYSHYHYSDINIASKVLNNALLNAKCCLLETPKHDTRSTCQHSTAIHGNFKNRNIYLSTLKWTVDDCSRERVERRIVEGFMKCRLTKANIETRCFEVCQAKPSRGVFQKIK